MPSSAGALGTANGIVSAALRLVTARELPCSLVFYKVAEGVDVVSWDPVVARFLDEKRYAVLATINRDGSIHQTVMWYLRDGENIVMNTKMGRRKPRNLGRDARASICMEDGPRYVTITGPIEIDDDPQRGQVGMRRMTTRYEGEERAEQLMRDEYAKQHRINLTLKPETINVRGFDS